MAGPRRYEDGCAFAQALDLVGERWAMLVMRELMFGPRRFTDLKRALPGIATNVLDAAARRARGGGACCGRWSCRGPRAGTGLCAHALGPRLPRAAAGDGRLGRAVALPRASTTRCRAAAAMLSLGSMFDPARAGDLRVALDLRLPDGEFCVAVDRRRADRRGGGLRAGGRGGDGRPERAPRRALHGRARPRRVGLRSRATPTALPRLAARVPVARAAGGLGEGQAPTGGRGGRSTRSGHGPGRRGRRTGRRWRSSGPRRLELPVQVADRGPGRGSASPVRVGAAGDGRARGPPTRTA